MLECDDAIAYDISLSCGKSYIYCISNLACNAVKAGQGRNGKLPTCRQQSPKKCTWRANASKHETEYRLDGEVHLPSRNLAAVCSKCGGSLSFEKVKIRGSWKRRTEKEIVDAFFIKIKEVSSVSSI